MALQVPPLAMQRFWPWSQQPPSAQSDPSQQGWPGPPQAAHWPLLLQARPEAVQKSAGRWLLFARPLQQFWPAPPHTFAPPPAQLPPVHVPKLFSLHAPVFATHLPATQQPFAPQLSPPQQGSPVPPQVTEVPLKQTVVAPVVSPEAVHFPPLQHPPPPHLSPGQQASPKRPQEVHFPPAQAPPVEQVVASATHRFVSVSQQPVPPHVDPAQHASPGPPQVVQTSLPPHARPAPLQLRPAQHCCPGPPHAAQTFESLHARPLPPQVRPEQHGSPGPPQWTQFPPTHAADAPVQVLPPGPAQQVCPTAPHVPQLPFAHEPPTAGHVVPEPVHVVPTQQPPPLQLFCEQQVSPAPPQAAQTPAPPPVQAKPSPQARPPQQT